VDALDYYAGAAEARASAVGVTAENLLSLLACARIWSGLTLEPAGTEDRRASRRVADHNLNQDDATVVSSR
jgi:hypothetical protein